MKHHKATEKELLDRLLEGRDPSNAFARDGIVDDLKKALSEQILDAELDEHLYEAREIGNSAKNSVLTGTSKLELSIPRDRAGTRRGRSSKAATGAGAIPPSR